MQMLYARGQALNQQALNRHLQAAPLGVRPGSTGSAARPVGPALLPVHR